MALCPELQRDGISNALRLFMTLVLSALTLTLVSPSSLYAQNETRARSLNRNVFSERFFTELKRIFGRFRDVDLQRVFDAAKPVQCSYLVSGTGEWREVAFFNEYRPFGHWYRTNLDDVRTDPAVYIFKGSCSGQGAPVQVTTEFPVEKSLKDFKDGRIRFSDIHIIINAPVTAHIENRTGAYAFDLPFLYRVSDQGGKPAFALTARTLSDRYAPDVTNHWECKSVPGRDVSYQFLICHTMLLFRGSDSRSGGGRYGTSAFSILSDGKEASSAVKLTFEDAVAR